MASEPEEASGASSRDRDPSKKYWWATAIVVPIVVAVSVAIVQKWPFGGDHSPDDRLAREPGDEFGVLETAGGPVARRAARREHDRRDARRPSRALRRCGRRIWNLLARSDSPP